MFVRTFDGFTTALGVSKSLEETVVEPLLMGAVSGLLGASIIGNCGGVAAEETEEVVGATGPDGNPFFSRIAGCGLDTGTLFGRGVGSCGFKTGG